jgi:hypothetical protein
LSNSAVIDSRYRTRAAARYSFIRDIRGSRTSGQDGAGRGLAIDEVAAWVSFTLGTSFFPSHVKNRLHTHIDLDEIPTM